MRPQKRVRSISRRGGPGDGDALEGKESPAGVIFMCSSLTRKDCFRFKVLGMPLPHKDLVERIAPGTILFLFDTDLKELYGIFEAVSFGGTDLEPQAFQDSKGLFPAQVRFDIYRECLPLTEDVLRDAIRENYFSRFKFQFELTDEQVARLIKLFHPVEPPRRQLDGSRFPRRLSREQDRVRGPPDYFYQEDEEQQEHLRQRALHPSVEMHPGYGHKGLGHSIPYEEFYRPEEHGHPNEDVYPLAGRGPPPIRSEDFYPPEEWGHHIPDEDFYRPKARGSPTPRDVFYPSEERCPPVDHGDFYTSVGRAPPIYHEEYYPSKVRVPPIYPKDFYPLEEQGPLDSRGFIPHKQQDHPINREDLYPHEDQHPHVPYEGPNPPIPYEVHQVPFRDDRQPLNVMEDRYRRLEDRYLPITEPVHPEDRRLPIVRNPAQHGDRFSLSHVRRHRNELDFEGSLPAYNNSAVEMINEGKQGDMLHLDQRHPPKRDAFNPADILEPRRMDEVDLLAMKYVKNDPNFIGNTRISPFSSTQPDAFDKKQMAGRHDPPTMSKAIGRPPLRRSHWNKERNLIPALGQETGAFRKFPNNI